MNSPKLRKRLLAGILCAGMIFQSVPMNASAFEDVKTVAESEIVETKEDAEEMQMETSVVAETADAQTKASDMILDGSEAPPETTAGQTTTDGIAEETQESADTAAEETKNGD